MSRYQINRAMADVVTPGYACAPDKVCEAAATLDQGCTSCAAPAFAGGDSRSNRTIDPLLGEDFPLYDRQVGCSTQQGLPPLHGSIRSSICVWGDMQSYGRGLLRVHSGSSLSVPTLVGCVSAPQSARVRTHTHGGHSASADRDWPQPSPLAMLACRPGMHARVMCMRPTPKPPGGGLRHMRQPWLRARQVQLDGRVPGLPGRLLPGAHRGGLLPQPPRLPLLAMQQAALHCWGVPRAPGVRRLPAKLPAADIRRGGAARLWQERNHSADCVQCPVSSGRWECTTGLGGSAGSQGAIASACQPAMLG